ncbi:hypothetical protein [Streptosporangium subroseum]|nr:hypothetical protein OHB15_47585 [Streptosporangium subroseum]
MLQSKAHGEVDDQKLKESAEQHNEHAHAGDTEIHDLFLVVV